MPVRSGRWRLLSGERRLPGNPASAVYGTILAAGQLAIESATGHGIGAMAASLVVTLVVFWLAHAYTDTLGSAITDPRGNADHEPPSFRHALRAEWPIVESAALPLVALGIGALVGGTPPDVALVALAVAALELAGWALLAARRAGLTGLRRLAYCVVITALGVALIGLKYAIH